MSEQSIVGNLIVFGGAAVGLSSLWIMGKITRKTWKWMLPIFLMLNVGGIRMMFAGGHIIHTAKKATWDATHIVVTKPMESYQLGGKNPTNVEIKDGQVVWIYER